MNKYLFITAALGNSEIHEAATRLLSQVEELKIFSALQVVTEEDIIDLQPNLFSTVPRSDWNSSRCFGFFSWKPLVANSAMKGKWGNFDAVFYLDAGCEVFPSYWNRMKIIHYLEKSRLNGAVVFSTLAPENRYTKNRVFKLFPSISPYDNSDQIAGGSWFLSGAKGIEISQYWAKIALQDYSNINNELELVDKIGDPVNPRHDQSIFSLICKSEGITPENRIPIGGSVNFKTRVRSFFFPFSWSRNKTGRTTHGRFLTAIGKFTLLFIPITKLYKGTNY